MCEESNQNESNEIFAQRKRRVAIYGIRYEVENIKYYLRFMHKEREELLYIGYVIRGRK